MVKKKKKNSLNRLAFLNNNIVMNEMNDLAPGCSLVLDVMSVCKHDPDYTKPYDPDYTKPHHNSD
jgi:hypothetical protein